MRFRSILIAAALTQFGLIAGPATAAIVDVTYSGVVTSGQYSGQSYEADYVFNTAGGGTYLGSAANYAYGGAAFGNTSPALSAELKIGSSTFLISQSNSFDGLIFGSPTEQAHYATDASGTGFLLNYIYNSNGSLPSDLTQALNYTVTASDSASGAYCATGGTDCFSLRPISLTETLAAGTDRTSAAPQEFVAATPVPGALPLFAGGAGVLGLLLSRGRKRKTTQIRP